MSELIIRSDGTYIEDFSGELVPVKVHYTRLDAPSSIDADHAVALEREAVAAWLENNILKNWSARGSVLAPGYTLIEMAVKGRRTTPQDLIDAIRNGAHHANTPPAAQKQG